MREMIKVIIINILCSLIIHFHPMLYNSLFQDIITENLFLIVHIGQGIALLTYPIFGWIAEVNMCHGRMIKLSFLVNLTSAILIIVAIVIVILFPYSQISLHIIANGLSFTAIIVGLAGLGMYEANAIKYGMDQMMEASSEQLSSFIHWYFWCAHVGRLLVVHMTIGGIVYMTNCKVQGQPWVDLVIFKKSYNYYLSLIGIFLSVVQIIVAMLGFTLFCCWRLHHIEKLTTRNSLKIIFQVLRYSYYHKYPERRSAFTYWENDIPSRIDLGKKKYGGPFTYEQVEDVKTFFRLLLVIISLFGFHLLGNGYSLSNYIINTNGCPTLLPTILVIGNPEHVTILIVVIGVPLFRIIQKYVPRYMPNMLDRLWIGLLLSLITEVTQVLFSLLLVQKDLPCFDTVSFYTDILKLKECILANMKTITNNTCSQLCIDYTVTTNILYLSIIPYTLQGIAYLLIFMTILEFICAQSPNSVKGLLIGIWYSTLSIKFAVIHVLDTQSSTLEIIPWNIYHGVKGIGIFLSIICFSLVCKYYHYRERNEVVNEQAIIEEQYERELLMNELDETDSSYDD